MKEIFGCELCGKPFKIVDQEFKLLKKSGFPIPRKCSDCRHNDRVLRMNPYKFWTRKCQCASKKVLDQSCSGPTDTTEYVNQTEHFHGDEPCPNEFETTYSPDRKEIVYCESCYQQEVN